MKNKLTFEVDTPCGTGILENVYITELGLIMAKVFFPIKEIWINYPFNEVSSSFKINIYSIRYNNGGGKRNFKKQIKND